jgi:uncharacterized membrane protein
MSLFATIGLILLFLILPAAILFACGKLPWLDKLGAVVVAYVLGLIIGNAGILPEGASKIQEMIMTVTIPLAIPLLLFSSDVKSWFRMAGKTFIALLIGTVMVVVVVVIGYFMFRTPAVPEMWKISGMLVGVYTGGTPNLAALGMMLNVDPNTYVITHTYDLFAGSTYLFFLLTFAQRFFNLFLPAYPFKSDRDRIAAGEQAGDAYAGIFKRKTLIPLLGAFGVAILIFALGALPTLFIAKNSQMVVVILVITSLGILASLIPAVSRVNKTFELGMYLILIFSLDVSSMANIQKFTLESLPIMYYCAFVIFGSLILQALISWIFKIDTDTMIITSTALICSPPFVPVVAGALRNREVILPGITVGIIGYAIGNYLGYMVATYLSAF